MIALNSPVFVLRPALVTPCPKGTHGQGPTRWLATLALTAPIGLATGACNTAPIDPNPFTARTGDYVEYRTLFVRPTEETKDQVALRFAYEVLEDETELQDHAVKNMDPLSIVVDRVYLPKDANGRRDILVVLDLATTSDRQPTSVAVWYQEDHDPGTPLGFDDLLVYSDRSWNATFSPNFKLRVLDVTAVRRASENKDLLRDLKKISASVSAFIPHPAIPGFELGVRVAEALTGSGSYEVLIDYTSQFYGIGFRRESGSSNLSPLMRGSMAVVARPKETGSEFWNRSIGLNRRTHEVCDLDDGAILRAPYVMLTVSTYESIVPTVVMERSAKLFELLRKNEDSSQAAKEFQALESAWTSYRLHSNLVRRPSREALRELFRALEARTELTDDDVYYLLASVGRMRGKPFQDKKEAIEWWHSHGRLGTVDQETLEWRPQR